MLCSYFIAKRAPLLILWTLERDGRRILKFQGWFTLEGKERQFIQKNTNIPKPYDFMEDKRGDFEECVEQWQWALTKYVKPH